MNTVCLLTLLTALHAVESDCGKNPKCRGNEYQITRICVDDVNRILAKHKATWRYTYQDVKDPIKARGIALVFMCHYGRRYQERTGHAPTARVYAEIFHLGYKGFFDPRNAAEGERYWAKVNAKLKEVAR